MKNRNQMKQSIATMQDKEKILDNKEMCMVCNKEEIKVPVILSGWMTCNKCLVGIYTMGAKQYMETLK